MQQRPDRLVLTCTVLECDAGHAEEMAASVAQVGVTE
jgi:hypothetical protein